MTTRAKAELGFQYEAAQLPELAPVLVATDDAGIEQMLQAARADVARLSLELRVARRKADAAERSTAALEVPEPTIGDVDLQGARDLLQASLSERVAVRRAELAVELEQTRVESARVVASAQRQAEAYVATAQDDVLAALFHPGNPLRPLSPLPTIDIAPPMDGTPDESVEDADDIARRDEVAPPLAVSVPAADGQATTAGVAAILAALQPFLVAQAAAPAAVTVPIATAPIATAVAPVAPLPGPPRPPVWSRLLYADVLLPLIAVVVVLVILIAWVG